MSRLDAPASDIVFPGSFFAPSDFFHYSAFGPLANLVAGADLTAGALPPYDSAKASGSGSATAASTGAPSTFGTSQLFFLYLLLPELRLRRL